MLFGFFLLIKAADVLVDGAAGLAKRFGLPKLFVGLTLVAFGTSAPEGTISIIAAIQGNADIAVGNIIGSNLANIALVLAVAAMIREISVTHNTLTKGIPLNILAILVLLVLGFDMLFQNSGDMNNNVLSLGDGFILIFFFIVFLYYIFGDLKSTQVQEEEIAKKERSHFRDTFWFLLMMIFGGLAGIMVGGKLVVDQAIVISAYFGVSEAIVGLTVVALGTSLPELITAGVAAYKNERDIAIGTIVGSNVLNVFLVLGVTSIITPVAFDPNLLFDLTFALFVTVMFYIILVRNKRVLTRPYGFVLFGMYCLYIVSIAFREVVIAFFPG